jgi:hypothetical protein
MHTMELNAAREAYLVEQRINNRIGSYSGREKAIRQMTEAVKFIGEKFRQENCYQKLIGEAREGKRMRQLEAASSHVDYAVKNGADVPEVRSASAIMHRMRAGGTIDRAGLQSALSLLRNALANDDARSKGSNVGGSYFRGRLLPYEHKAVL